jgi:DeoR family transcriptional regulator, suf operon transcriptional repressor
MEERVHMLRPQLVDTSRGRVVSLLQRGPLTAHDLAARLEISPSAVRTQISAMERDGVVRQVGSRPGTTRPSRVFELTPEVEQLLSRAYIPLLTQLVDVFARGLPGDQLDALLREAGRRLAGELPAGRASGTLRSRIHAASEILNTQLGAVTRVDENGPYVIRGNGCPLSALTGKHPAVCRAMESLVEQVVGTSVHECCERIERPRCCFEISSGAPRRAPRSEPGRSRMAR